MCEKERERERERDRERESYFKIQRSTKSVLAKLLPITSKHSKCTSDHENARAI